MNERSNIMYVLLEKIRGNDYISVFGVYENEELAMTEMEEQMDTWGEERAYRLDFIDEKE